MLGLGLGIKSVIFEVQIPQTVTVRDGKEKSTTWKGTELHDDKEPTAQCITETGKFLDSEHS